MNFKIFFKTIAVLSVSFVFSGCFSMINHTMYENDYPYRATKEVWTECIDVWWSPSTSVEGIYVDAYVKFTYPFWIVDFPCEAVVDTVCLPWDIVKYKKIKKESKK